MPEGSAGPGSCLQSAYDCVFRAITGAAGRPHALGQGSATPSSTFPTLGSQPEVPSWASSRAVACNAHEPAEDFDGLTFSRHMIAGGVAGIVEHVTMFPVDTVKTRMQALSHPGQQLNSKSVKRALKVILKREGVAGLYHGVGAVALGAGPSHALYFATYELMKNVTGANGSGHRPLETAMAGMAATAVSDLVMTPWDVIKQRLQVEASPYSGVVDCATKTWHDQGLRAFFKSYRTTLVMNIPFVAIHFPVYESAKKLLRANEDDEGLLVQIMAGGTAGGIAAGLTNPLDVVKTRLQTEGVHSRVMYSSSEIKTIRMIVQREGAMALLSGVKARVLFHIPAAAVSWCTYESVKALLRTQ